LNNDAIGENMVVSLLDMQTGQSGVIVNINGGRGLMTRLENMGIRISKKIKKIGSSMWRGPQTVEVDHMKIAVGYGMAGKIFVEVVSNNDR
jgi:ferrous iron transport protein A